MADSGDEIFGATWPMTEPVVWPAATVIDDGGPMKYWGLSTAMPTVMAPDWAALIATESVNLPAAVRVAGVAEIPVSATAGGGSGVAG